jgi:hypothetical protein
MSILKIKEERLVVERVISAEELKEAISIKCANCYAAMSFANALGGSRTDAWYLCRAYTLKQLLDEASSIGLNLSGLKSAIDDIPIEESLYYKRATGEMDEQEFRAAFSKWQRGEK